MWSRISFCRFVRGIRRLPRVGPSTFRVRAVAFGVGHRQAALLSGIGYLVTRTGTEIQDTRTLTETQGSRGAARARDALDRIVETKRKEAAALRGRAPELRRACVDAPPARDFAAALRPQDAVALIAEVKRRSPGAGAIRPELDPASVAWDYERAGASAVSVLTDGPWFGGSLSDLVAVRARVGVPVLRKDFTLVEEQVLEARVAGADAVLLIARILDDVRLRALRELAESLGMSALVEVHDASELDRALAADSSVVGVNNRDLATFLTSLDHTFDLLAMIPADVTLVSESGIRTPADVDRLGAEGVHAVLVGEALLREPDPGEAARALSGRPRRERARV
ncbi:MAG: indole-3-glycerol phosphate synthase TrpC [Gemmatimonadetes bacterium]|nr:indole-3-glycerol phosphate synthase TrpC [Gemmatimonadota bacterium]